MDELTAYLTSQSPNAQLSPEMLEMMGKEAANLLLSSNVALNESVVKLASAYPGINAEHIQRVCEFANNAVYLAKHDQHKTAGKASSYPQFVLADASRVIQDLSDGARPAVVTPTDVEYGMLPAQREKVSSAQADEMLQQLFPSGPAPLEFSKESAVNEIFKLKDYLKDLRDNLSYEGERSDLHFKEASADYYLRVRNHLLEGGDFSEVMFAASSVGAEKEKTAALLNPVVVQLLKEKIASADALSAGVRGMDKLAHRVINPEHPLVSAFATMVAADEQIEKIACGLLDAEEGLKRVSEFIKESYHAGPAAGASAPL